MRARVKKLKSESEVGGSETSTVEPEIDEKTRTKLYTSLLNFCVSHKETSNCIQFNSLF